MDSELTGRKVKVSKQLRRIADEGLTRIEKIVGKGANAHVILSSQKHGETAEVTVNARRHKVVGAAEAAELGAALRMALDKAEKQAIRRKKSLLEKKRQGKSIGSVLPAVAADEELPQPGRNVPKKPVPGNGKASGMKKTSGMHVVSSPESVASRPMTVEEAVKEAESGDLSVFVFRDLTGDVKVLHCAGDGIVRLIEVS